MLAPNEIPEKPNKTDGFSTDAPFLNSFIAFAVFLQNLGQGVKPENHTAIQTKFLGGFSPEL